MPSRCSPVATVRRSARSSSPTVNRYAWSPSRISACSGTRSASSRCSSTSSTLTNAPGRSAPSGFSNAACSRTVRVAGSTAFSITRTSPSASPPGSAPPRAITPRPWRRRGSRFAGTLKARSIGSMLQSSAIGVPGVTSEPELTCRTPIQPANGASIVRASSVLLATSIWASASASASWPRARPPGPRPRTRSRRAGGRARDRARSGRAAPWRRRAALPPAGRRAEAGADPAPLDRPPGTRSRARGPGRPRSARPDRAELAGGGGAFAHRGLPNLVQLHRHRLLGRPSSSDGSSPRMAPKGLRSPITSQAPDATTIRASTPKAIHESLRIHPSTGRTPGGTRPIPNSARPGKSSPAAASVGRTG